MRELCATCGADWRDGKFGADCPECGGGALERACPMCDGACGSVWRRAVLDSRDTGEAHWIGACREGGSGAPRAAIRDRIPERGRDRPAAVAAKPAGAAARAASAASALGTRPAGSDREQIEWWLDSSSLPGLYWARLAVRPSGAAAVTDLDGVVHRFASRERAADWLRADEYQAFAELRRDGVLPADIAPPKTLPDGR